MNDLQVLPEGKRPEELGKMQLWQFGQKKLGYGDWTPDHPMPYGKWAGLESHKLFLVMRKRKISNAEFLLCVDYCHRHHKNIENAIWVFTYIADAKKEQTILRAERTEAGLATDVEAALAWERASALADAEDWISKLSRARGHYREEVISEWRAARNQ